MKAAFDYNPVPNFEKCENAPDLGLSVLVKRRGERRRYSFALR
jgi:hypothetical protein